MTNFGMMVSSLKQNIARAVVGKDDVVELMLTALLCEGHVLIEDVPGVGKTTLASALARSLSCSFKRIQFTPDITPSDITGFTMPSLSGEMQYHPGAIMSQIVLADEINRTSPKTQSALLEVMEERQVTVDGVTYPLARPFMVLATHNRWILSAPIPCRKRRWTASSCAFLSAIPLCRMKWTFSTATAANRNRWNPSCRSARRRM